MKRCLLLVLILSSLFSLVACSNQPSLELTQVKAVITNDDDKVGAIGVTEGEKKGKDLSPTALYYEFTIKNIGKQSVGEDQKIDVKLQPTEELSAISNHVMGLNIFNSEEYLNSGLGYGETTHSIKAGEESTFTLYYLLGTSEEIPNAPLLPSESELKVLEENALKAILIVTLDGQEIARFDLSKTHK